MNAAVSCQCFSVDDVLFHTTSDQPCWLWPKLVQAFFLFLQDAAAKAQLQHQQAVDKHTSDAATCNAHVQHLSNEVQQQQVQIVSLQEHVQAAQQQRDAAQRQLESLQAQHAQQAPQVAELLTERKAWIQDLQKERAAASAAASAAEVCCLPTAISVSTKLHKS